MTSLLARAVTFDGTNDYLTRGAKLTGLDDSPTGVTSFWFRGGLQDLNVPYVWVTSNQRAGLYLPTTSSVNPDGVRLELFASSLSVELSATFTCPGIANGSWHHLAVAWRTDLPAGSKLLSCSYDGASIAAGSVTDSDPAFNVRLSTSTDFIIAAQDDLSPLLAGTLAEMFWHVGSYLDLTDAANRAKFYAGGLPVDLGADGSYALGVRPLVYLSVRPGESASAFATNRGTGGNFTIAGALVLADMPERPPVAAMRTRNVVAMVATPFDQTITQTIAGPPWPFGSIEEVQGGINDFSISGGQREVYASDVGYHSQSADTPSLTWFPHALKPSFSYSIRLFQGSEPDGRPSIRAGNISIINEKGDRDVWLSYAWDGRAVRLYRGVKSAAFSTFSQIFAGTADGIEWTDRSITIRLRDKQAPFIKPIQTSLYGGAGGIDGDSGVKGRQKPLGYGRVRNAKAVATDAANLVYQVHDGAISAISDVRDKGVSLTFEQDLPTYAQLLTWYQTPGFYATCLATGHFRLGGSPDGTITADFNGALDTDGMYVETTADILSLIARTRLGEDAFAESSLSGFDTLNTDQPAAIGYFCDEAGKTVADVFNEIASAAGVMWWVGVDGQLNVKQLQAPAAPAALTLTRRTIRTIAGVQRAKASQRRRVGYDRMWFVQDASELATSVSESNRQRYGSLYRFSTAQDSSIPYAHKLAGDIETLGLFALEADAITEAARLLALHGSERGIWTVPVAGIDAFDVSVGDIVEIEGWDRLGLDPAGSYFVCIGIDAQLDTQDVVLTLWG